MKMYHYVAKGNDVFSRGILSFAENPSANLRYYFNRTGGKTAHKDICEWMESCFEGRSRGIRCFSEPIKWNKRSIRCLKEFVDNSDCFEIDISAMHADGLIEAVYVSPPVTDFPEIEEKEDTDEILLKLKSIENIDFSPVNWTICDDEAKRRFAYVRYYLIVVKGGIIAPKYLKLL